jgi:DNA-binding transcriptional regulator YiaG
MAQKPLPTSQTLLEHYTPGKDALLASASAQFTPGTDPWSIHVLDAVYRHAWHAVADRIEPDLKAYLQLHQMMHGPRPAHSDSNEWDVAFGEALVSFFEPYFAPVLETNARDWLNDNVNPAHIDTVRIAEDVGVLIVGDILRSRDGVGKKLSLLGIASSDWAPRTAFEKVEEGLKEVHAIAKGEAKPAKKRKVKAGIHLSTEFLKRSAEELGLKPTNLAKLLKVSPTVIKTAESNGAGALISKDGAESLIEHLKASIRRRQEMLEGTLASLMDYQTAQGA